MRQTLVKEGLQLRLPDLLGSDTDYNNQFSIQSSMLEDMNRICKALVGGSQRGRVMAGMTITNDGLIATVSPGYSITPSGKIIKLAKPSVGPSMTYVNGGATYNIYANYSEAERTTEQGGFSAPITRSTGSAAIIMDQLGATDASLDIATPGVVITYDVGPITVSDDKVYIGSLIVTGTIDVMTFSTSYPISTNTFTSFVYKENGRGALISGTRTISTVFTSSSEVTLAEGSNSLKSIQLILRGKTTNSIRLGSSADDYLINFSLIGKKNGGFERTIATGLQLGDNTSNNYNYQSFPINQVLSSDIIALYLSPSITGDTGTNAIFTYDGTQVECSVSYVIEKLT